MSDFIAIPNPDEIGRDLIRNPERAATNMDMGYWIPAGVYPVHGESVHGEPVNQYGAGMTNRVVLFESKISEDETYPIVNNLWMASL